MNKLPLDRGRVRQKIKTRASILAATKRLLRKSARITLEDVAGEAGISRATIYRYFSNVDLLVMEASLDIQHPSVDEIQKSVEGLSVTERVLYIQGHFNLLAQKHENAFRRYLSAALSESVTSRKKVRGARRVQALRKSLETLAEHFHEEDLEKLINIASVLMGIDALIVTKDVCDLDNNASSELLEWGLTLIMRGMDLSIEE